MEGILITFLVFKGVNIVFRKWGLDETLEWIGAVTNVKFIYEFTKCSFCRNFWGAMIVSYLMTIRFGSFEFSFSHLITIFVYAISCAVLNIIIDKLCDHEI